MFNHVTIGTGDLARAAAFYDAALAPLGIGRVPSEYEAWAAWRRPGEAATLWVGRPYDGLPAGRGNGWVAAFAAPSRAAVDAAHAAAVAAGGRDERAPRPRPRFAPDYCGAYVRDPDGNKPHFVRRGEWRARWRRPRLDGAGQQPRLRAHSRRPEWASPPVAPPVPPGPPRCGRRRSPRSPQQTGIAAGRRLRASDKREEPMRDLHIATRRRAAVADLSRNATPMGCAGSSPGVWPASSFPEQARAM